VAECAKHAINNLLQYASFSSTDMVGMARQVEQHMHNFIQNPIDFTYNASFNNGWYDVNVMEYAFNYRGYAFVREMSTQQWLDNYSTSQGLYVVNRDNNHWFSIRKVNLDDDGYNMDSCITGPQPIQDINTIVKVNNSVFKVTKLAEMSNYNFK
jgi:hypothetical protein